jgi:predicted deacetylase
MSARAAKDPRIVVVFRNDDPSAVSDVAHERRLFEVFEHWNVPQTIGVVPNMTCGDRHARNNGGYAPLSSNPAMIELLVQHCAKTGSELALHGFTHQTNRFSLPARKFYFEFARLPLAEQETLLREGAKMIESATHIRPRTFIPPWNRLDANTVTACEKAGFSVLSTHVFVPAARTTIPFGTNSSLPAFQQHLEAARRSERRVFIHLLLHTPLMQSEDERRLLDDVLRTVRQEPDCEAMTVLAAAERFADELREFNRAGHSIIKLYEDTDSPDTDSPRARAQVYARLGLENRVTPIRQTATEHYRAGNYTACLPLDARIDEWSQRFVWGWRLAAFAAALAFSKMLLALSAGMATATLAASFVTLWVAAIVAMNKATSPDSRREIAMLAAFINSGLLIGRFV